MKDKERNTVYENARSLYTHVTHTYIHNIEERKNRAHKKGALLLSRLLLRFCLLTRLLS